MFIVLTTFTQCQVWASETVCGKDAAIEPTGTYLRRVAEAPPPIQTGSISTPTGQNDEQGLKVLCSIGEFFCGGLSTGIHLARCPGMNSNTWLLCRLSAAETGVEHPTETEVLLDRHIGDIPSPWETVRLDAFTHHYALAAINKRKPKVIYIAYGETDDFAHDGEYDPYILSANRTDRFIREF